MAATLNIARGRFVGTLRARKLARCATNAQDAYALLHGPFVSRVDRYELLLDPRLPETMGWASLSSSTNTAPVGVLGASTILAAARGGEPDKTRLIALARYDSPVGRASRQILDDFAPLVALARQPYGVGLAEGAQTYLRHVFRRVATALERGDAAAVVADAVQAWAAGSVDVVSLLLSSLPAATPLSDVARDELDILLHDTVRHDIVAFRNHLPAAVRRGDRETAHCMLRGAATRMWSKFLRSSCSAAALFARQAGVKVRFYQWGELILREGLARGELALVLRELVHNAVKYRDPRKRRSTILVRTYEDPPRLRIVDNGIGIREPARIWEVGYREERGAADGSGLGLSSVRRRLHRIGWSIEVASRPDCWTAFTLTPPSGDLVPEEARRPRRRR